MNTILLTAFLGIVLMMIGAFSKSKTLPRFVAIGGIIVILIANMVELLSQESFFTFTCWIGSITTPSLIVILFPNSVSY